MKSLLKLLGVGVLSFGLVSAVVAADKAPAKASLYSVKLASVTPVAGYEESSFGGSLIFTAANAILGAGDIVSARATTSDIVLTLTAQGATNAATAIRSNVGARLAVLDNGRVVAAPVIDAAMLKGTSLTASTASLVPSGPAISVVAAKASANPNELVAFDVFVSGAADLRGYQVALQTDGGNSGKLNLVDIHQDTQRADFVFGSAQIVNAVDLNGGRAVAALFTGSIDAATPKYLGTFTYQSSPDAVGTFTVQVKVSEDTALRDSQNNPIGYQASGHATLRVGGTK